MKKYYILLLLIIISNGCGNKTDQEAEIKEILKKAASFEKRKMYKQAIEEYQKLKPYEKKPAFTKLDVPKILKMSGWDLEDMEQSHTIRIMTDYQNRINSYFKKNNQMPDLRNKGWSAYDAWGAKIRIQERVLVKHKGKFDYMVISKGPDGKYKTADDLVLVNKLTGPATFDKLSKDKKLDTVIKKEKKKPVIKKEEKKQPAEEVVDLAEMIRKKRKDEEITK